MMGNKIQLTKEQKQSLDNFLIEFKKAFGVEPELVEVDESGRVKSDNLLDTLSYSEEKQKDNNFSDEVYEIARMIQADYHDFILRNVRYSAELQPKHNMWLYFKLAELQDQINKLKNK